MPLQQTSFKQLDNEAKKHFVIFDKMVLFINESS